MLLIDSLVIILFVLCFVCTAEAIYWSSKNEYLKAKAKYLRNVIDQKNDINNNSKPYFNCVYESWDSEGMPISEATANCKIKLGLN